MEDKILICDCASAEHQMVLRYDDDEDLGRMVYVEIHLVNKRWYKRLWIGLKYIFGYKCCYGNFEEMILSPKHARQIYDLYRFLNRSNLEASETMREKDEIDQAFTDMMLKGGQGMSCYDCKHYEPWGGLGDVTLQHYCGKDGQVGVRCNPSESENCNGYKPRKED